MWPLGATPREARCPDMTLSPDQAIFARQLRQLGVNIAWVGSPTTVATTALKLAGPALYGSYAVSDFAADSSPTAKEFATKYEATYKSAPDFNGASTYDAVHVLKKQSIWAIISREMIFLLLLAQNELRSHIRSG
jgi:Periplasmic binding protein